MKAARAFVLAHEVGQFRHRDHSRGIIRDSGSSVALRLIEELYGDTSAFGMVFDAFDEAGEFPSWAAMLSTHPPARERVEALPERR